MTTRDALRAEQARTRARLTDPKAIAARQATGSGTMRATNYNAIGWEGERAAKAHPRPRNTRWTPGAE